MKTLSLFILLFTFTNSQAQFFAKLDKDKKFNGVEIDVDNRKQTKNCTLVKETIETREWRPEKNELKTKNFTLKDIIYESNFHNAIWRINAISTDAAEQKNIMADMASGAKQVKNLSKGKRTVMMHTFWQNITALYIKDEGNDTATIVISFDSHYLGAKGMREQTKFIYYLGNAYSDVTTREFLSSFFTPESSIGSERLKSRLYSYNDFGIQFLISEDTLRMATVYNNDGEFKKFEGAMPRDYDLSYIGDEVMNKLGKPFSSHDKERKWYYRLDRLQVEIKFFGTGGGWPGAASIRYISFRFIPASRDAELKASNDKENELFAKEQDARDEEAKKIKAKEDEKKKEQVKPEDNKTTPGKRGERKPRGKG